MNLRVWALENPPDGPVNDSCFYSMPVWLSCLGNREHVSSVSGAERMKKKREKGEKWKNLKNEIDVNGRERSKTLSFKFKRPGQ